MRKPRELRIGARYHVTARVNRKEMIFDDDTMKALFLRTVKRAKEKYNFRIENFCIMGNHFHFIIQPGKGECLSAIMQWILGVFAMRYNKIKKLWGHLWGSRFYSVIIENFYEYLRVFSYIDNNPVKAKQVENTKAWMFGGLWHHRSGIKGVIEDLPAWCLFLFFEHRLLQVQNPEKSDL
jgi:putative transposase